MIWQLNVPRGDLLPLNEVPRFSGNWTYIQTELRDDHYWDEESDHDGHHKRVGMTDIGDTGIALDGSGIEPAALPTSINGQYYLRPKTATEAPEGQFTEPFYMMNDGTNNIINQMGIRAMLSVRLISGTIQQNNGNNWDYQHNIATVTNVSTTMTITFSTDMPTNRYLVILNSLSASSPARVTSKTTSTIVLSTGSLASTGIDLIVLGG